MKSIIKIAICISLLAITLCLKANKNANPVTDYSTDFFGLFQDPTRSYTPCDKDRDEDDLDKDEFVDPSRKNKKKAGGANWTVPHKKKNNLKI